jgi:hypothetical protein
VVARGGAVTFSVTIQSSQTMSDEVIAASGQLGRSALFVPVGGNRYRRGHRGKWAARAERAVRPGRGQPLSGNVCRPRRRAAGDV